MTFWKFSFKQTSAIDTLLEEENVTLAKVLQEDDVIQECKVQNKKLIAFLTQPEIFEELVKLVTTEPPSDVEEKSRFRMSHMACEIFTSGVGAIVNELSADERFINLFWEFLDKKEKLNPLIGSFLSKVISVLLTHHCALVFEYIQKKENFLSLFLSHLNTSAINDLLLQMIALPDMDQTKQDLAEWFCEHGIVEMLLDCIQFDSTEDVCINVAQLIGDILRIGRESTPTPSPVLSHLEDRESIDRLLCNMLDTPDQKDYVLNSGMTVLLSLMETRRSWSLQPPIAFETPQEQKEENLQCLKTTVAAITERFDSFKTILLRTPKMDAQLTTLGLLNPPFGFTRLQVLRLMSTALMAGSTAFNQKFIELEMFTVLLDLFFQYPWNNFLHTQVLQCVNIVLEYDHNPQLSQENSVSIQDHLFQQCNLLQRLLDGHKKNDEMIEAGGHRQGYMGHLIKIVNSVQKWHDSNPQLRDLVQNSSGEEVWKHWTAYLTGPLAENNRRNEANLGGQRALTSSFDDSEDDFETQGSLSVAGSLEREYAEYRSVQFVTYMDDDFGSVLLDTLSEPLSNLFDKPTSISLDTPAEEEQCESLLRYQSACTSRIQQFDESISDDEEEESDDPWPDKGVPFSTASLEPSANGVAYSSSDEENDSAFDGLRVQRGLKNSFSSSDEEDLPSPLNRQQMYLPQTTYPSGYIDTTTHHDLSKAGLDDGAPTVPNRNWLDNVDSDSDSDNDDTKPVVGGGFDWTKEEEGPAQKDDAWATFNQALNNNKDGTDTADGNSKTKDVDLASEGVTLLLSGSDSEGETVLDGARVLPQETESVDKEQVEQQEDQSKRKEDHVQQEQDSSKPVLDIFQQETNHSKQEVDHSQQEGDHSAQDIDVFQQEDHLRQEINSSQQEDDHSQQEDDHSQQEDNHSQQKDDHSQQEGDHSQQEDNHSQQEDDHSQQNVSQEVTKQEDIEDQQLVQATKLVDKVKIDSEEPSSEEKEKAEPVAKVLNKESEVKVAQAAEKDETITLAVDKPQELATESERAAQRTEQTPPGLGEDLGTPVDGEDDLEPPLMNGPSVKDIGGNFEEDFDFMPADYDSDDGGLDDNYNFLSKGLLSRPNDPSSVDQEDLEKIRQSAKDACHQFEQETQRNVM